MNAENVQSLSTCCKFTAIMVYKTSEMDHKKEKVVDANQYFCSYGTAHKLKELSQVFPFLHDQRGEFGKI